MTLHQWISRGLLAVFLFSFVSFQGSDAARRTKRFIQLFPVYGSSIELTCPQHTPSQPASLWRVVGFASMSGLTPDGKTVEQNGPKFTIYNITTKFQGTYMCRSGRRRRPLAIVYLMPATTNPPIPIVTPQNAIITGQQKSATLTCVAIGDKISSVAWFKAGNQVSLHNHTVSKQTQGTSTKWTNVLLMDNITKQDDGKYECRVVNVGRDYATGFWPASSVVMVTDSSCLALNGNFSDPANTKGYIECINGAGTRKNCTLGEAWDATGKKCHTIAPKMYWLRKAPSVNTITDKRTGQSIVIDCQLSNPEAEVHLYHKTRTYKRRVADGCKVTYFNQTFTIHALVILDDGQYYCDAKNISIKKALTLNVIPGLATVLGTGTFNFIVAINSSIDLECRASIIPGSEISLELSTMFSKTILKPDGKTVIKKGNTFTIHGIDRDKRGTVFCKTTSRCGGQATGYKIGRLVPYFLLDESTPKPSINPSTYTMYADDKKKWPVMFQCTTGTASVNTLVWLINGQQANDQRVSYSSDRRYSNLSVTAPDCSGRMDCSIECRVTRNITSGYWFATAKLDIKPSSISSPPEVIKEYTSANIKCSSNSTLIYHTSSKGQKTLRRPDGAKIKWVGNSFHIELFDVNDVGKYLCTKDDDNPKVFMIARGVSSFPGVKLASPNETTIDFNGGINLVCYTNKAPVQLTWTKGKSTAILGATQSFRTVGSQSVLEIRNANKNDEGIYICSSNTSGVLDTASVKVHVKDFSVPTVVAKQSRIITNETSTITLSCTVRGSPVPSVTWMKNGKEIANCRPFYGSVVCISRYNASSSAGSYNLVINNATYGINDTDYECIASNKAGKAKASIKVVVYVTPLLIKTSPGIHYMVAKPSENFHLECSKKRGYPAPTYIWHQAPSSICQGRVDDCKPRDHQWKDTGHVTEVMTSPPMTDIMLYKCTATNAAGQDTKLFAVVRMDTKPPKITQYQNNITVNGTQPLEVSCHVDGVPTPDVFWEKNNQTIAACTGSILEKPKLCNVAMDTNAARFTVRWMGTHALLTVHSASHMYDGGSLKCLAKSQVGKVEAVLHVIVHESPKLVKQGEIASYFAAFGAQRNLMIDALSGNPPPHYKWYKQPADHCMTAQGVCKPRKRRWVESVDQVSPATGIPSARSIISLPPTNRNFFYKVEAVNHMGVDIQVFSVVRTVDKVRPDISTPGGRTVFDQYDTIKIQCKASLFDFDALDIQRKDGRPFPNTRTNVFTKRVNDDYVMTLVISNIDLNDAGVYSCLGYTSKSISDSEIDIIVKAAVSPAVSLSNKTILSSIGQVILNCHVTSGYPRPQITWYKEGNIIKLKPLGTEGNCSSFSNGFYHLHGLSAVNSESLVICDPRHGKNTGWYSCNGRNVLGIGNATSYLNVHEAPTVRLKPGDSQIPVEYGQSLSVNCTASGNPTPITNWTVKPFDKDKEVKVNSKYIRGKHLYISSVNDVHFGKYTCRAYNQHGTSTASFSVGSPYVLSSKHPASKAHLIAAVVVGTLFLVLLIVSVMVLCRRRQMYGGFYLCTTPPLPDLIKSLDPKSPLIEQVHKLPYDPLWEYPRDNIAFGNVLGTGAFGKVYFAETEGCLIVDTSSVSSRHRLGKRKDYRRGSAAVAKVGTLRVAVKTLKENATESDHNDLLSELKILIHVGAHKNIVNLLGACTKGAMQDLWVIIEYCPYGDLLQFLKNKRHIHQPTWDPPTDDPEVQFSLTELVSAAYQVARGMEFLSSRLCIHRDLAARNVLVGENYVMKVADFGLARDIYRNEEYVKQTPGLVPIKWMALESLVDKVYSQKSDVWSFGILMWEIFTLGGNPYPELHPSEVYEYLVEGKRMPKPDNCPQEIHELMTDCWMHGPDDRPTFSELVLKLDKAIECNMPAMGREAYLELDNIDDSKDQNYNKEVDGYLQPTDIIIKPKEPQTKDLSGNLPEPAHDYTEIPDVFPVRNGGVIPNGFEKGDEKHHLLQKPLEYEMAMKSPRYVNIEDIDGSSTTML